MSSQFIATPGPTVSAGRLEIPVRDLMRPGVIVIAADASIVQVQRALLAHGVHAILVVDDHGHPLGWVTSRGVLPWCGRDVALHAAREAVTEPAVTVEPSITAAEAIAVLQQAEVSRLLVARRWKACPRAWSPTTTCCASSPDVRPTAILTRPAAGPRSTASTIASRAAGGTHSIHQSAPASAIVRMWARSASQSAARPLPPIATVYGREPAAARNVRTSSGD